MHLVPSLRYSALNNGVTLKSGFGVVQGHRKLRLSIDHNYMTIYFSAVVSIALSCVISSYLTLNNIVTLKSRLRVTEGHWKWHHSKVWVWLFSMAVSLCLLRDLASKNGMTSKTCLAVVQGH